MPKRGRPKGTLAASPARGTATNRVLLAYDATQDGHWRFDSTAAIAKQAKCSQKLVIVALNRWRPDWRTRLWPAEALEDTGGLTTDSSQPQKAD